MERFVRRNVNNCYNLKMGDLNKITIKMMSRGKGILALDESNSTAGKRLDSIGMENTEENRRQYRDLFIGTDKIGHYLSGVILYEETLCQKTNSGEKFIDALNDEDVLIGIKVDQGAKDHPDFPDEKITEGLDGLADRLKGYYEQGARFTKWRAVVQIDEGNNFPSKGAVTENAIRLAKYAKTVQEAGMVPIIEPEVLLEGIHSIEKAEEVLIQTLKTVFEQIKEEGVELGGLVLKTSMAVPGNTSGQEMDSKDVAKRTVRALQQSVFLSGGQTSEEARNNLNEIAKLEPLPWELAFSYARAIQGPALKVWQGKDENLEAARETFIDWLVLDTKADKGELDEELEY
jgi:fructose-bisphosphate aldolase class I